MGFEVTVQFFLPRWSLCYVLLWSVSVPGRPWKPKLTIPRYKQFSDPKLAGLNTLTFSVWISRGAGLALSIDGAIILLPMCRNMMKWIRPKIKFLPLDESQWFHRQVAYSMLFYTILHVSAHYVK
jgi:hypothetical protein